MEAAAEKQEYSSIETQSMRKTLLVLIFLLIFSSIDKVLILIPYFLIILLILRAMIKMWQVCACRNTSTAVRQEGPDLVASLCYIGSYC